jgi:prepilin-type processing-associated H-X9-DG protein
LAELVIVIAIIGILLALLVPGFSGAWAVAYATQCQLNLRHIYEAFIIFDGSEMAKGTVAEGGLFPDAEFWPGIPYLACPEPQVFACPCADASPYEFANDRPVDPETGGPSGWDPEAWPPLPPVSPTPPPQPDRKSLDEFLQKLRYVHRVRGFEVGFADPAHQGLGHMNLGTREGADGRGQYIEIGLDDNSVVTANYMDNDGHDGIIRLYQQSDGQVIAKLMKYSCGELNCVLYKNEPLFTSPADPAYVTNPADPGYGHLGPGASKNGMEVVLSDNEEQAPPGSGGSSGGGYGPGGMRRSLGLWAVRISSNYGMTRGAEKFQAGPPKPLIMDFSRRIVDPTVPQFTDYLYNSARHSGQINVLFTDGSIRPVAPSALDPLMPGNERLYLP